jgi:CysZ protein
MLAALNQALEDSFRPEQRRAIALAVAFALLLLAGLWAGVVVLLDNLRVAGIWWVDRAITLLGSLGAAVLAWILFPTMTVLVLGFFAPRLLRAIEARRYPDLGPPRSQSLAAGLSGGFRFLVVAIAVNVIALPFYLIPAINLLVYYVANGYLVGRAYFELVALRRLDEVAARAIWRRHRGRLVLAGAVIALLLSVPLINLVAPVTAAAFMLHIVEGLRRNAAAETFAGPGRARLIKD